MGLHRPRRIFRSSLLHKPRHRVAFAWRARAILPGLALAGALLGALALWDYAGSPAGPAQPGRAATALSGPISANASSIRPSPEGSPASDAGPAEFVAAEANEIAVVDGSTLRLAERVVRLSGIATPARGQNCHGYVQVSTGDCAAAATAALAALVRQARVACEVRGHDSMGHALGVCEARGTELNRALVASGWARAGEDPRAGRNTELKRAELLARAQRRGLWNGGGDTTW